MLQSFEFLCTQRSGQGIVQINFSTYSSLAGNSGRLNRVRLQQPQEQCYPFLTVRAVFSCVQSKVWLPMCGIFNVRTDVNASDCTQGLCGHRKRDSALKVGSWRKIPCRTGESNLPQRRAGPTLYKLSYISAELHVAAIFCTIKPRFRSRGPP